MMWGMGSMWIWGLILVGAVVLVVVMLARAGGSQAARESPEAILKRRYARGEIDREEYERRLEAVRK